MKLSFSAVYIFTALVALTSAAPVPIPAAQCKRIDIRRNIADLTTAQRDTFFSAIQKLKDTPDPNASDASIYDKYVKIHTDYVDQGHGNAQFIPWHRVFIRQFELELQSVEPSVVLPYWDWSISSQAPERSIVFTNDYLGGNGDSGSGCVTSGRFANWQTRYPSKGCLQRRFDGGNKIGAFTAPELLNRMIYETNSYADFESQLEYGIHGRVHVGVGGTMGQMWSTSDPLFYLHHANVDRLWSMYQGRGEKQATEYNGQGPSNRAVSLDDVLLPFNKTVREAMDMVNNLCYSYTQQDIPTPGDQSTPTPSVIVVVPTVTPTILQSSTPTPATSTPVTTTTPATTPTATQVQEPEITPVTTPLPEATPIVTSTVPDQIPETTTVTETTTTATPIPETTTVTETTTTATPIPETTTVTETTTTATQIPETTTVTEAPTTPTPATPESTRVTGTTPIVSATPVATAQPTNTSQPPNSSGTVDAYDRSNMGKIRMPVRIPEAWLIMNRLSLDKYAAHEATLLQLVKQYNSRSVSSVASLQFYKDVPTCDVISDKVFQAYGVPVPNKKILHLTAPIGKVRYLSADGVTGSDGGSHVNPRNLPVADLTASDGSTNPVGSNPTTSSATTLAPAIPLAGLIAAAVLLHW